MTATPSQSSKDSSANAKKVEVIVTYLEQTERPVLPTPARPHGKHSLMRVERPPLHFYRYLYRLVGDPWKWVSRRRMDDEELAEIIHDPSVYIYVLYVGGAPAGFTEIDNRNHEHAEIRFFGLAPDFTGQKLGRFFLTNVIDLAWSLTPKKLRIETCTLDHPAALPLYQKMGFRVFDRRDGIVDLID